MVIGIIGGGQLGMMIAEAAKKYSHTIIGLDPTKGCSLSKVADEMIVANYDDLSAIEQLVQKSDVVTYEFENVDLQMIDDNESKIPQRSKGLRLSRNRLVEKDFARQLGIKTPRYLKLTEKDIFAPSIIKTTTGGYDGKGQYKLKDISDFDQLGLNSEIEYIVEELIEFDYEISVVGTRDTKGNVVTYPIPINEHRNGILYISTVTDELNDQVRSKAIKYTVDLMTELEYVGTLAVEYFIKDNDVIFNEFAPRPHNSGHYTIEGCNVSQFENHVRAITGMDVITPFLLQPTIMVNVLGQDEAFVERNKELNHYYHSYFKEESRVNRKMGHITITSDSKSRVVNDKDYITGELK